VSLYYYSATLSDSVDDTVFTISVQGRKYQELTGRHWWHPRTKKRLAGYYATSPRPEYPEPGYVVIEVNDEVDVIEHREYREQNRDPYVALFWMADDSQIVREGRDSKAIAETLR